MDFQTFQGVSWIEKCFENRGKILQVILARTFEAGGASIDENLSLVEGKDIHLSFEGQSYGVEVKTTEGDQIQLGSKDFEDFEEKRADERVPGVAVLRLHPNAKWRISGVEPFQLRRQFRGARSTTLPITAARVNKIEPLQNLAGDHFDSILPETVRMMKQEGYEETDDALRSLREEFGY